MNKQNNITIETLTSSLDIQLLIFNTAGNVLFSNWNLEDVLGECPCRVEQVAGWLKQSSDNTRSFWQYIENCADSGVQCDFMHEVNDNVFHFRIKGSHILWEDENAWVVQVTDVTREYSLFREMELLERQASAGEMAAGVAHEFNNILTAMMGWTQLAVRSVQGNEQAQSALATIENNTHRARKIAAELLEITSPQKSVEAHALYIGDSVKESLKLLSWDLSSQQIHVVEEIFDTAPSAANATRLVQVFINIIKNAIDAMGAQGTLGVRVIQGDGMVSASFSDTGEGISDEALEKIFQPFFSTKTRADESHGGNGLGMAISKRIIEEFNGNIQIERAKDAERGTVVTVSLPATDEVRESIHDEVSRPSTFPPGVAVLVVDDEPDICEMIRTALTLRGAHVVSATNGEKALQLCQSDIFNAVFLDFSMAGLSGHQLRSAIGQAQPSLPVVFMSGVDIPSLDKNIDFLKKPFDLHDIQCKLREILERK